MEEVSAAERPQAPASATAAASAATQPATPAAPATPGGHKPVAIAMNVLLLMLVAAAVAAVVLALPFGPTGAGYVAPATQRLAQWQLATPQGTSSVSLPHSVNTDALQPGDAVTLTVTVDAAHDTYLYVYADSAPLEVYVDGRLAGSYGEPGTYPSFMSGPAPSGNLYYMGAQDGTATVELRFAVPATRGALRLSPAFAGPLDAMRHTLLTQMGWMLFVSMDVFTMAIAALAVSLVVGHRSRHGASYFWLALFVACSGFLIFGKTNLTTLVFRRPVTLTMYAHLGMYASLVPYARLVRSITKGSSSKVMDAAVLAVEAFAVVAVALQLLGVWQFSQSIVVCCVLAVVVLAYLTYRIASRLFGPSNVPAGPYRFYLASAIILDIFLPLELLNTYALHILPDMGFYVVGMVCFMAAIVSGLSFELRQGIRAREEREALALRLREVENRVTEERRWYNNFTQSRRELRRQRNHLHYQLSVIRAYAEDEDFEGLVSFVDDLDAQIPNYERAQYSDEFAVDAVVGYYVDMAREAGIQNIEVRLGVTEDLPEDLEDDVCTVVGNLLSNAIADGREVLAQGGEPAIRMTSALLRGTLLNINMQSSYCGQPRDPESDVTLRSIDACAQGHGGSARFEPQPEKSMLGSSVIMRVG